MRRSDLTEANRPYRPRGAARELMRRRDGEVLLCGPAGTGKSRACLEKLHLMAERYPGMRGLILRKTRASCTESALVTYEDKVLPRNHPALGNQLRENRHSYKYPNGSEIVVGGMDKPSKTLSTEYDVVYVQEAIELREDDWETLTRPLRNGVLPYQQIIADTNPAQRTHWLKLRCDTGKTAILESRHEDNPALWDADAGQWTPYGADYIGRLDNLTGVRYWRLRKGLWVSAEGMVYEEWDPAIHLVDRFPIPGEWPRWWAVDFGYTNPFCWQAWAEDPDGRLFRYREVYHTQRLVADHARDILRAVGALGKDGRANWTPEAEPRPRAVICDHDAEDRATLERALGLRTIAAFKATSPGREAVQTRLRPAGDEKPRLLLMRDSLVERDKTIAEKGKPCCSEEEVEGYVWDESAGRRKGEEPVKENDHGMDAMRYLVAHVDRVGEQRSRKVVNLW